MLTSETSTRSLKKLFNLISRASINAESQGQTLVLNTQDFLAQLGGIHLSPGGERRFCQTIELLRNHLPDNLRKLRCQFWFPDVEELRRLFPNGRDLSVTKVKGGGDMQAWLRYVHFYYTDCCSRLEDLMFVTGCKLELDLIARFQVMALTFVDLFTDWVKWYTVFFGNYLINSPKEQYPLAPPQFGAITRDFPFAGPKVFSFFLKQRRKPWKLNTIFHGFKKGLLPITPIRVLKTLSGHHRDLTSEKEVDKGFKKACERYIEEVLPIFENTPMDDLVSGISSNAGHRTSRSRGGVLEDVINVLTDAGYLSLSDYLEEGIVVEEGPLSFRMYRSFGLSDESIFAASVRYLTDGGNFDGAKASVRSVLEPNKARIMTAASPLTIMFLTPVQKWLLRSLSRFPGSPFKLPLQPDETFFEVRRLHNLYKDTNHDLWVSGDYSSATDKMVGWLSPLIMERLESVIPVDHWIYSHVLSSMYGLEIKTEHKSVPVDPLLGKNSARWSVLWDQTSGQLMGSIVSFPVLCLANLFAYWYSWECWLSVEQDEHVSISLEMLMDRCPVAINGDDILFKTTEFHYPFWVKATKAAGFELSLGKNFVNPNYAMINSALYDLSSGRPQVIPYVNFGLLCGRGKGSVSSMETDAYKQLVRPSDRLGSFSACWNKVYCSGIPDSALSRSWRVLCRVQGNDLLKRVPMEKRSDVLWSMAADSVKVNKRKGVYTSISGSSYLKLQDRREVEKTLPRVPLTREYEPIVLSSGDQILRREGIGRVGFEGSRFPIPFPADLVKERPTMVRTITFNRPKAIEYLGPLKQARLSQLYQAVYLDL